MLIKLSRYLLPTRKRERPSAFSFIPKVWQENWDNVREEDEKLLWSSLAFSGNLPSLEPYVEGWLIVSNRGVYFACKLTHRTKLLFRRGNPPIWRWNNGKVTALVSFLFEEEEWQVFLPRREELFRSRLFLFEARENRS
ncbi:MAG: hypothetical protein N2260_00470 [Syntrophobacterales bacterium]|nr:hypothetical protein [Syntrophobacterales bacterium]